MSRGLPHSEGRSPSVGSGLDVLLVVAPSPHAAAMRVAVGVGVPPLGVAQIAAVLRDRGLRVRIADLNVGGWSRERFERLLACERPKVVGLSCLTESYRNALRLSGRIRRVLPGSYIVGGGPHVTFEDEAALRTGGFDVVVRGEGESTAAELFPRLVAGLGPAASIAGIAFIDGVGSRPPRVVAGSRLGGLRSGARSRVGRRTPTSAPLVVRGPDRPHIEDLDSLPWPARELLPFERYASPGAILTGRGCPGRCLFCSAAAMSGGRRRARRPEAVLEEILALRRGGIREIVFLDDTLTGDRDRLDTLLLGFERRRLRLSWSCESRVEAVDPALLRRMARLGCHAIQYGIESGAADSRRRVGKPIAAERIEAAVAATTRAGIVPVCSFVLGLPWDDAASLRETIELGLSLQRRRLAIVGFGVLVCFPGTPFWRRPEAFGLRRRSRNFDEYAMHIPTCETPHLDLETLRRVHFEATVRQMREMPHGLLELMAARKHWRAPT